MNKRVPSMLAGIVVLVGSAALFLREPLRAQTAAATSAKTVGQAFKNIQVLKNIPADELGVIRPEDTSCLTTRLWDKYLPKWRKPHPPFADLPTDILDAIEQMEKGSSTPHQRKRTANMTLTHSISSQHPGPRLPRFRKSLLG